MAALLLLLLCVITSQAAPSKDTVVTNLIVEATTSAANKIDISKFIVVLVHFSCVHKYAVTYKFTKFSSYSFHTNSWRGTEFVIITSAKQPYIQRIHCGRVVARPGCPLTHRQFIVLYFPNTF